MDTSKLEPHSLEVVDGIVRNSRELYVQNPVASTQCGANVVSQTDCFGPWGGGHEKGNRGRMLKRVDVQGCYQLNTCMATDLG